MKLRNLLEGVSSEENILDEIENGKFTVDRSADIVNQLICDNAGLVSLRGCPKIVQGQFNCANNQLVSLKFGPITVNGSYDCSDNLLSSLEGCPKIVTTNKQYTNGFYCAGNKLSNLVGGPETVIGYYVCDDNPLESLIGIAHTIEGDLSCNNTKLASLKDIHKLVKRIDGSATFTGNDELSSNILGLLLIDGLKSVEFDDYSLTDIINKHLKNGRDLLECQDELIEAGFEKYAKL